MSDRAAASDEALVAAYVAGDAAAFDELVSRYQRRVYGICYRYFGDRQDAEDAAQETFLTLLRRAETYTARARFSTWLYRVAMNACNDLSRKRARRPRAAPSAPDPAQHAASDDPVGVRELALDLQQALAALEPEHRDAVVLHDVHGLPYADIAARLGVPVGTVKSRIHRGHARLAALLRAAEAEAPAGDDGTEPLDPARPPTGRP